MQLPRFRELLAVCVVLALFLIAAVYANLYEEQLMGMMYLTSLGGKLFYVAITTTAVVVAPISTFPLIPIAVGLWGPFTAAVLSIIGWTLGGMIAFWIARSWGRCFVAKFVDFERAEEVAGLIAGKYPFVSVLMLRMVLPVDVLSYAVGLFLPSMTFSKYTLATLIGVCPFAFIFAYATELPLYYQILVLVLAGLMVLLGLSRARKVSKK